MTEYLAPPDRVGLVLDKGDVLIVSLGGVAVDTTINNGGREQVFKYGEADGTTINAGGVLVIINSGSAYDTTINGGKVFDDSGVDFTTINAGGVLEVGVFAVAVDTTINNGGREQVFTHGEADGTTINAGGVLSIHGGSADDTTINGGRLFDSSGVDFTTINAGGVLEVSVGGFASNTTINGGELLDAGRVHSTTINAGGVLELDAGTGFSMDTAINAKGVEIVERGGLARNVEFGTPGGKLLVFSPAELQGTITNWSVGDVIDFEHTLVARVFEFRNEIRVIYGSNQKVDYKLPGQQADTHVTFHSDGHGGTELLLI